MSFHSRRLSWSTVMRDIRTSDPTTAEFVAAIKAENAAKVEAVHASVGVKRGLVTDGAFNLPAILAHATGEARIHRQNDRTLTWDAALAPALRFSWACAHAARRLTVPAAAVAAPMPAALRLGVLARAWAIFRASYAYPRVPFRSIGRACFAASLRAAWAEARQTARLAGFGVEALKVSAAKAAEPRVRVAGAVKSTLTLPDHGIWPHDAQEAAVPDTMLLLALATENAELRALLAEVQDQCVELAVDAGELHAEVERLHARLAMVRQDRDRWRAQAEHCCVG